MSDRVEVTEAMVRRASAVAERWSQHLGMPLEIVRTMLHAALEPPPPKVGAIVRLRDRTGVLAGATVAGVEGEFLWIRWPQGDYDTVNAADVEVMADV